MDEDNPDTNPLNFLSPEELVKEGIDLPRKYPKHLHIFTRQLRRENSFNPLIAAHLDSHGGIDVLKIKQGKKTGYILSLTRTEIIGLNSSYFSRLQIIREGIQKLDHGWILTALENIWKEFGRVGIKLSDFLEFKGIFSYCRWIYNDASGHDPIHDIILSGDLFDGWEQFTNSGPKWKITEAFGLTPDEMADPESSKPIVRILQGKANEELFKLALERIDAEWFLKRKEIKKSEKINERKLDGYAIPDWIEIKEIPPGIDSISAAACHRIRGFANVLRGKNATDNNDFRKSIRKIAEKYLSEKNEFLLYCDLKQKCFWIEAKNLALFKAQKQGRKRRPELNH